MSLKTIRLDFISKIGTTLSDEQAYIDKIVNDACIELYDKLDLVGSLREIIICFDPNSKIISLPWYVDKVRGLRFNNSMLKINLNDMRPRYHNNSWGKNLIDWRELGDFPLAVKIHNQTRLTFRLPKVEANDIKITIIGNTAISERVRETITLAKNTFEVTCEGNYKELESITKDIITTYNIKVFDCHGVELGIIPNSELSSRYKWIQVADNVINGQIDSQGVEVLFKNRFTPLVNDDDKFLFDRYDKAVYWKMLEHYWAVKEGGAEQALGAHEKCDEIVAQVNKDFESGKEHKMETDPNKFYGIFRSGVRRHRLVMN